MDWGFNFSGVFISGKSAKFGSITWFHDSSRITIAALMAVDVLNLGNCCCHLCIFCNDLCFYLRKMCVCVFPQRTRIFSHFSVCFFCSHRNNVAQVEVGILWCSAATGLKGHGDLSEGAFGTERKGPGKMSSMAQESIPMFVWCILSDLKCMKLYERRAVKHHLCVIAVV